VNVLEVRDFSVEYGLEEAAVHAVRHVDLDVARSSVLGIAGESGSGKSTLVYGFTRLLRWPGVVAGGSAVLRVMGEDNTETDVDLLGATERELRSIRWSQISIVLQSALSALNPVRRIAKEFDEVLRVHRSGLDRRERRARAVELLEMVGLEEDRLDRFPHELSGGQRQRIMIALALALDPQLVIMDEPTTALDVVTQREIVDQLFELRQRLGFAMIFITHDLSLLVELADEIVVMYAGEIVERASATELYAAPRHPYTLGLIHSFPPMHGERRDLVGLPGAPADLAHLPTGCSFHPRCAWAMEICKTASPKAQPVGDTGRLVACWLHDGIHEVPVELRRSVPERQPL
jgi:peptide/nickel transport system ATP-binding protein